VSYDTQAMMDSHEQPPVKTAKRAYSAPKLVRLGSVRDLTFGASGPVTDKSISQHGKTGR
jgi:hypothetical protein